MNHREMPSTEHVEFSYIKDSGKNKNCYVTCSYLDYQSLLNGPINFLGIEYNFADPNNSTNVLDLYYLNKNGNFVYFITLEKVNNDDCYDNAKGKCYREAHSESLEFKNNLAIKKSMEVKQYAEEL